MKPQNIRERERERNRDIAISSFSFYHFILPSTSFYLFISELSFALGCLLLLLHMFTLAQGLPIILDWASAVHNPWSCFLWNHRESLQSLQAQKAEREASDLKGTMRKRMEFLDLDWCTSVWHPVPPFFFKLMSRPQILSRLGWCWEDTRMAGWTTISCFLVFLSQHIISVTFSKNLFDTDEKRMFQILLLVFYKCQISAYPRICGIWNQTNWSENLWLVLRDVAQMFVFLLSLFCRGRTFDSPFMKNLQDFFWILCGLGLSSQLESKASLHSLVTSKLPLKMIWSTVTWSWVAAWVSCPYNPNTGLRWVSLEWVRLGFGFRIILGSV